MKTMVYSTLNHIQGKIGSRWAQFVWETGVENILIVAIDAAKDETKVKRGDRNIIHTFVNSIVKKCVYDFPVPPSHTILLVDMRLLSFTASQMLWSVIVLELAKSEIVLAKRIILICARLLNCCFATIWRNICCCETKGQEYYTHIC